MIDNVSNFLYGKVINLLMRGSTECCPSVYGTGSEWIGEWNTKVQEVTHKGLEIQDMKVIFRLMSSSREKSPSFR